MIANAELIDQQKLSKVTKSGIRVISEMSKGQIIAYLAYECRVGLWSVAAITGWGFIAYDKVVKLFV